MRALLSACDEVLKTVLYERDAVPVRAIGSMILAAWTQSAAPDMGRRFFAFLPQRHIWM
jgi:hypothetical protein